MRLAAKVTTVVMEATSDYWKLFYYLMEDALPVMMVNAKAARNIPGRKADVSDAAWLAQLGARGLLRASFVPLEPIRQLRDLTRARTVAVQDRPREAQRLEKFLESSGIKLSDSVSNLMGASSRAMLSALIGGERDPQKLAELVNGVMRKRILELVEALKGRFQDHHAFICAMDLKRTDSLASGSRNSPPASTRRWNPCKRHGNSSPPPRGLHPRCRRHHRRNRGRHVQLLELRPPSGQGLS